jgi:hypothetical protein
MAARHPSRNHGGGRAWAVAGAAGRWVVAAAGSDTGRRVARAAALTVTLAVLIGALYDRGEVPTAAARPAAAAPAAGAPGGSAARARAGGTRRPDPAGRGGLRGRARATQAGPPPAAVAAAWYAARQGLPAAKVEALQQDRLSASEVRVLVLADHGRGRLQTALVRVRLGPAGWSVR